MIIFRDDLFTQLYLKGYTTTRIRREKILGESTLSKIRKNEHISTRSLETICRILECQPGDVIQFIPDETVRAEMEKARQEELEFRRRRQEQQNTPQ